MNRLPMTSDGYNRLQEEIKRLKSVERPAIIRAIAEARTHGDLSENAEYHAARDRQSFIEGRLGELEDKVARAEVIDTSKLSGSVIKFGATVTLSDEETDEEQTFRIVGEDEADPAQGSISYVAPLARALLGKAVGDVATVAGSEVEVVAVR
jgi:transcription elongation factor GreA